MEVDEGDMTVVSESSQPGLDIQLHPVVVMNISEHFTRTRMQAQDTAAVFVVGAVCGTQDGRHVEIFNSFALILDDDGTQLSTQFFEKQQALFKRNFENLDLLGWYCTGSAPSSFHLNLHKQICSMHDSPLFLLLNPRDISTSELPISVYETVVEMEGNEQHTRLVKSSSKIVSESTERIGVEHIARTQLGEASVLSEVDAQLTSDRNSVQMLCERIKVVRDYVVDVQQGKVERNHTLLREINSLCSRLPITPSEELQDQLKKGEADASLVSALTQVTKAIDTIHQFSTKSNALGRVRNTNIHGGIVNRKLRG